MKKDSRIETKSIHAGDGFSGESRAVTTPIFQTSTFRLISPGDESGYVYSRTSNPTRQALEQALASVENGTQGFAFASGMAAVNTVLNLLSAGDEVVVGDDLYGGCYRLFNRVYNQYQIKFTYVDGRQPINFENAVTPKTKLFWLETPTNPLMYLYDIREIAAIAHRHDFLLAVDNTFATPFIQRPLELDADIVVHSLTKYISGHCDMVGGAVVVRDSALAGKIAFYQNAVGAILSPFDSFLAHRGLKTLPLRMERHSSNARKVAEFLKLQNKVDKVLYPGLDGSPLPNEMNAGGGMVSFVIDATFDEVKRFVMATSVFTLAESLGGVESLINHPATMTHASIPENIRRERGIVDGLVRLSVGLEHIDDLIDDLKSAFRTLEDSKIKQPIY